MNRRAHVDIDPNTQMTPDEYEAVKPYAVVIEWDDRDGIFLATVPDIRGCRTHGATRDEAARMGEEAVAMALASRAKHGLAAPEPRFTAPDDAVHDRAVLQSA